MTLIESLRGCDLALAGDPPVATVEVAGTRVPLAVHESDGRVSLRAEIAAAYPPPDTPAEMFGLAAAGDTRFALIGDRLIGTRTLAQPTLGDLYDAVYELAKATCSLSQLLAAAPAAGPAPSMTVPAQATVPAQDQTWPQNQTTATALLPEAERGAPGGYPGAVAPPEQWQQYGPPPQQPVGPPTWTAQYEPGLYQPTAPGHPDGGRRLLATAMWISLIVAGLGVLAGLFIVIVPLATGVDGAAVFAGIGAGVVLIEAAFGVAAWLAGARGQQAGRIVVTVLAGLTVAGSVVNLANGASQGAIGLLVGVALLVLWWLPLTTEAMGVKRSERRSR